MNPEPAVLISAFEVPEADDEAFLQAWERARAFLRAAAPEADSPTARVRRSR
jgi:hypothetical protein